MAVWIREKITALLVAPLDVLANRKFFEVTLTLLLPYHPYNRPTPAPLGFDGTFYPPGMEMVPKRAAIVRANRYMVEHSDYLIAYAWHSGNAWDLVEYAQKQGKIQISILPR